MNADEIATPSHELIERALDSGDVAEAKRLVRLMRDDWMRNKDFSINWIASLLSFIGKRMGEDAVEEALRGFGESFIAPRRAGAADVPPRKRAEAIARAMKANGADVIFDEEADRFVLSFRCGSGGMLIDEGAYDAPDGYLTLRARGPVTFGRDELPVYCAHCSVNNEIQPIEWDGAPATVEFPPASARERCVHHVYKDRASIPQEIYDRVGKPKPL